MFRTILKEKNLYYFLFTKDLIRLINGILLLLFTCSIENGGKITNEDSRHRGFRSFGTGSYEYF
jgi:hypothetical protein